MFWTDGSGDGSHPEPFTLIKSEDIENGTWVPVQEEHKVNRDYLPLYVILCRLSLPCKMHLMMHTRRTRPYLSDKNSQHLKRFLSDVTADHRTGTIVRQVHNTLENEREGCAHREKLPPACLFVHTWSTTIYLQFR